MIPHIFFSYGMTKCGTTLAFQLARTALNQAGMTQMVLKRPGLIQGHRINSVQHIDDTQAEELNEIVHRLGYPLVLKTHTRPDPAVVRLVEQKRAKAHAVIRDLRDMALSMMDHGKKSRDQGQDSFSEIASYSDARDGIDNQLDSLTAWMQLPDVEVLKYDHIAFDTLKAAQTIMAALGITGDPERVVHHVLTREFTQKNQAIPERYKTQMSAEESTLFQTRYAPFNDLLLSPAKPKRLPPATDLRANA